MEAGAATAFPHVTVNASTKRAARARRDRKSRGMEETEHNPARGDLPEIHCGTSAPLLKGTLGEGALQRPVYERVAHMSNWVETTVKGRALRQLIAWSGVAVFAALFAYGERRYLLNFTFGPYPMSAADLNAISNAEASPRYFVTVNGEEAIDTGIERISIETRNGREVSRKATGKYYALRIGDRFLIFETDRPAAAVAVGSLERMPPDVWAELLRDPEVVAIQKRFYPFYVNEESFRVPGYIGLGILCVFGYLLWRYAFPAWGHFNAPSSHPAARRIRSWGSISSTASAIQRELAKPRFSGGGWRITEQYLVNLGVFSFDAHRLTDLFWVYKAVTQHRVNFVPAGKTYAATFGHREGLAQLTAPEATVDAALEFVFTKVPWVVVGFSDETKLMFDKNRIGFGNEVMKRRQEYSRQSAAAAAAVREGAAPSPGASDAKGA